MWEKHEGTDPERGEGRGANHSQSWEAPVDPLRRDGTEARQTLSRMTDSAPVQRFRRSAVTKRFGKSGETEQMLRVWEITLTHTSTEQMTHSR